MNKTGLSSLSTPCPPTLPSPVGLGGGGATKIKQKLRLPVATGSSRRVVMETVVRGVLNVVGE